MGVPKYRIRLAQQEREILSSVTKKHTEKQSVVKRTKIILMADEGKRNQDIAATLGVNIHVITTWTKRWLERSDDPVEERLQDLQRPGAPDTFTPEQWCRIIALACEHPADHEGKKRTDLFSNLGFKPGPGGMRQAPSPLRVEYSNAKLQNVRRNSTDISG